MNFSTLQEKLTDLLDEAIREKVFPGAVAGVSCGPPETRQQLILSRGTLYSDNSSSASAGATNKMSKEVYFDLASLTKPLATVLSILCLIKSRKIRLSERLPTLLGLEIPSPLADITLAQLLGHCSGLAAHQPYYQKLQALPPRRRKEALRLWLLQEKPLYIPGSKTVYSDLGYMFLSWIVERQANCEFEAFVRDRVLAPLGLEDHLFFKQPDPLQKAIYAPTENCPWRGKILSGEVHDDNCYAMGGVSGHAGLFGNIHGVLSLAQHLLDVWQGWAAHPNYTCSSLKKMTKRQDIPENTWGLGFDTPSTSGSSAGKNLSGKSFGHLGFTGTSFWIDPEANLVMVLLSNRVHPSRENERIRKFRPNFHDTITDWLISRQE